MAAWRKRGISLALLVLTICPARALELSAGRIKLVLHEEIGRFSLYALSAEKEQDAVPLFVVQDPRTSSLSLVIDGKIVKMGEGGEFTQLTEKTPGGARFVWRSNRLRVVQDFSFLPSQEAAEGIKMSLILINASDRDIEVGARLFVDTYLGEPQPPHFKTDRLPEIKGELTLTRENKTQYWASPSQDRPGIALQCLTDGAGITVPDQIVFANWKRLDEAPWFYETSPSRNFNLLPYSINDSAVCQYYAPRSIKKGSEWTVTVVLRNFSLLELSPQQPSRPLSALLEEAAASPEAAKPQELSLQMELKLVNDLIAEINRKLASEKVEAAEIKMLEDILGELQKRADAALGR